MERSKLYSKIVVMRRPTFKKDMIEMILSLFIMSLGVVLSVKADLGVAPISSLPNVITLITGLSLGTTVFITYFVCVILQCLLLKDRNKILITFIQLPFTLIFSIFVDALSIILEPWEVASLAWQWVLVVASCLTIGLGIVLEIDANISLLADDGLVLAIHRVTKIKLDRVMILFDVSFVAIAFILSYAVFHDFHGVGLGTIFTGVALGLCVKLFTKIVKTYIRKDGYIGN